MNLSYGDMFQWAFALSPIPSYLPQYFSIMRQLAASSSSADDVADDDDAGGGNCANEDCVKINNNVNNNGSSGAAATERGAVGADYHLLLRKRNNLHDNSTGAANSGSGREQQQQGLVTIGSPSKSSFKQKSTISANSNGNADELTESNNKPGNAGLSRATVLLLLSSHLLRLLHFHGLVLQEEEEERPFPPIMASAGGGGSKHAPAVLQWDLIGQSLSMIAVQITLLHATMLLRRKKATEGGTRRKKRTASSACEISGYPSADSLSLLSGAARGSSDALVASASSSPGSDPQFSLRRTRHRRLAFDTIRGHLRDLFSPHNVLHEHSFLQYLELLFLSSVMVKLAFDYRWYPLYGTRVIEGLKRTSVCMESCLALPQMIRNYRNKTTEGLSAVMVGGWVAGDFFKLCYFSFGTIAGGCADGNAENPNNNNGAYALGSLLSLSLDSVVGIQMAWWYPEPSALRRRRRIIRSARRWRTNRDDGARGECSLLIDNDERTRRDGLRSSLLRTFFRWVRGIRPPSSGS